MAGPEIESFTWPVLRRELETAGVGTELWSPKRIDVGDRRGNEAIAFIQRYRHQSLQRQRRKRIPETRRQRIMRYGLAVLALAVGIVALLAINHHLTYAFPNPATMAAILAREGYLPEAPDTAPIATDVWDRRVLAISYTFRGKSAASDYDRVRVLLDAKNGRAIGLDAWSYKQPNGDDFHAVRGDYLCRKFFDQYKIRNFSGYEQSKSYAGDTLNIQSYRGIDYICKQFTSDIPDGYTWLRWYFIKSSEW